MVTRASDERGSMIGREASLGPFSPHIMAVIALRSTGNLTSAESIGESSQDSVSSSRV